MNARLLALAENPFPMLQIVVLFVIGAAGLPVFNHTTNCGGNSAALTYAGCIALTARAGASDSPDHSFRFADADAAQRRELQILSRTGWLRKTHFLVSTVPVSARESEAHSRRILVVCDTPFRNVPQQWFGTAPPTHAAGFADGSRGLISPAEFAALDRSTFTPLDELYSSAQ